MTQEELTALEQNIETIDNLQERITLLNELSQVYAPTDQLKSLDYAEQALRYSHELGEDWYIARSMYRVADCRISLNEYQRSEQELLTAAEIIKSTNDRALEAHIYVKLGDVYRCLGQGSKALEWIYRSAALIEFVEHPAVKAFILMGLGDFHNYREEYAQAYEYLIRSSELAEEAGMINMAAESIIRLGTILNTLKDYEGAIQQFEKAIPMCRETRHWGNMLTCYGNIGGAHSEMHDYNRALPYFLQALELSRQINSKEYEFQCLLSIAFSYVYLDQKENAISFLQIVLERINDWEDPSRTVWALSSIAKMFLKMNEEDKALEYAEQAIGIIDADFDVQYHHDLHEVLSLLYERRGDFSAALLHSKRYTEWLTQQQLIAETRAIAMIEARAQIDRIVHEKDEYRLRAQELETELEEQNRQLTALALNLAQKSEFVKGLRGQLASMNGDAGKNGGAAVKKLVAEIDHQEDARGNWQTFEQQFQKVHPGFAVGLLERYPDITKSELRICILLKINLSNKEIADLLSTGIRNVEQHRRNIRKKLGLTPEVDLATFLAKM